MANVVPPYRRRGKSLRLCTAIPLTGSQRGILTDPQRQILSRHARGNCGWGLCVRICCDNRSPFTGSPFTLDTRPFTVPVHTPSVHAVHTDQKRSVISVHSFRSPPVHGSPPFTVTPVHGDIRSRARRSQVPPVHEISVHRRSPFIAVHGISVHRSPPFTGSPFTVHRRSRDPRSPFTAVHGIPVHRSPPFTR